MSELSLYFGLVTKFIHKDKDMNPSLNWDIFDRFKSYLCEHTH